MENDVMDYLSKPGAGGGNNVLSGLALCLLEDRVCLKCVCVSVCVCECVCVSVCVSLYIKCMLIRVLLFHSVCFQCLLSILLSSNTSAAPLVSVHVTDLARQPLCQKMC